MDAGLGADARGQPGLDPGPAVDAGGGQDLSAKAGQGAGGVEGEVGEVLVVSHFNSPVKEVTT